MGAFGDDMAPVIAWAADNIEALVATIALIFTGIQLWRATTAFQASTLSQVAANTADLQWKCLQDRELRKLFNPAEGFDVDAKSIAAGMVINHFATSFDLYRLGGLPDDMWSALKEDMRHTLCLPEFSRKWNEVERFHGVRFRKFVNCELLRVCHPKTSDVAAENKG